MVVGDLDMDAGQCTVMGKGRKERTVYFSPTTRRAVWDYLRERQARDDEPLFVSTNGRRCGEALTVNGLYQAVRRLARLGGLENTRVFTHRFRHTSVTNMLRGGMTVKAVQTFVGHSTPKMTLDYAGIAKEDVRREHMRCSPMERYRRGLKKGRG
jgi:integrase/recombinase XerD